jgi:hypothetical protein
LRMQFPGRRGACPANRLWRHPRGLPGRLTASDANATGSRTRAEQWSPRGLGSKRPKVPSRMMAG